MDDERKSPAFLSDEEKEAVTELRQWVENEADFKSRIDDEFLLVFLRASDLEQRLSRKTLTTYYRNKINVPQWWTDRALSDPFFQEIFDQKIYTKFTCLNNDQPVVTLLVMANMDLTKVSVDEYAKAATLIAEYVMRLENSQLNGYVGVADVKDFQFRPVHAMIILKIMKNVMNSFYIGMPIKLREIHVFNVSYVISWLIKTFLFPFLPASIKERLNLHHEELSSLCNYLPPECLPEELGGTAGPLSKHHTAFWEDLQSSNGHLLDEDNYGYGK